jgi:hypothetical protein
MLPGGSAAGPDGRRSVPGARSVAEGGGRHGAGRVLLAVNEVIVRVPRSDLKTAEVGHGYVAPLTLVFTNGDTWRMEVPPPYKRRAKEVVHALGG